MITSWVHWATQYIFLTNTFVDYWKHIHINIIIHFWINLSSRTIGIGKWNFNNSNDITSFITPSISTVRCSLLGMATRIIFWCYNRVLDKGKYKWTLMKWKEVQETQKDLKGIGCGISDKETKNEPSSGVKDVLPPSLLLILGWIKDHFHAWKGKTWKTPTTEIGHF